MPLHLTQRNLKALVPKIGHQQLLFLISCCFLILSYHQQRHTAIHGSFVMFLGLRVVLENLWTENSNSLPAAQFLKKQQKPSFTVWPLLREGGWIADWEPNQTLTRNQRNQNAHHQHYINRRKHFMKEDTKQFGVNQNIWFDENISNKNIQRTWSSLKSNGSGYL